MNRPVVEPERDIFFKPLPVPDEPDPDREDRGRYPLHDMQFGTFGNCRSPKELSDEQLLRYRHELAERKKLYRSYDDTQQHQAVCQEIQRRGLKYD
jgi:hypothetical protein